MIKFREKPSIPRDLEKYIEMNIIPKYKSFDKAHREDHVRGVIKRALYLNSFYGLDPGMVYAAASYHDIGLSGPRETHEILSGKIVKGDKKLSDYFSLEQIDEIAKAVEDHRSSNKKEPRNLLGKIIAEADRVIDCQRTLERTLSFGISNYPKDSKEEQIQRAMNYISEKYGPSGRIKIWIPESPNLENLEKLQKLIKNKKEFYKRLSNIYDKI